MTPDDANSADVFISKFDTLRHFYQSPAIIDRVAYEAVADAAAENITYLELRFTPIALAREKGYDLRDVADWVIGAVNRAQQDFGIDVRLIVSMNRHESVELGDQFVDLAIERMDRGIVAVDLAGLENRFPGAPFEPVFRKAREAGLAVTIHAGEWAGADSISEALDLLGATRLGHGVRILEDPNLVARAIEQNICLEVCVTSNVQTGVAPTLEGHALPQLYGVGLLTTINTDDPSISAINLTDEYVIAAQAFDFGLSDLKQHIMNSARAAFLTSAERAALIKRLQASLYPSEEKTAAHPKS